MLRRETIRDVLLGAAAATTMGLAMAQSVPPDADIANPAIGAGQQNSYGAPMGETGINEVVEPAPRAIRVPIAVAVPATPVIAVAPPKPEVIVVTPAPPVARVPAAPPPVVMAPEVQPAPQLAQAPVERQPEPMNVRQPMMRADRN